MNQGKKEGLVIDKEKGELTLFGRRHIAVDAEALCRHLDSCVGSKVAEVIMNNHENRMGREDAEAILQRKPGAMVQEVMGLLVESDATQGMGVTTVRVPSVTSDPVDLEIANPAVKETTGAAKGLALAYWCGVLSFLLKRDYDVANPVYDPNKNVLRCQLKSREKAGSQ